MDKRENLFRILVSVWLVLAVAGGCICGSAIKSAQNRLAETAAPIVTLVPKTDDSLQTPEATPLATEDETQTPEATSTPAPTPTPTPSPVPTPTPEPTPTPKIDPSKVIERGNTSKKQISIVINVAWHDWLIPDILDILDRYNVKITFFVTGDFAEKTPEYVKMIAERGHEIGTHGYKVDLNPDTCDHSELEADIAKSIEILQPLVNNKISLYMAQYESISYYLPDAAAKYGCKFVYMTYDAMDWKDTAKSSEIVSRLVSQYCNGAIILGHPTNVMVEALPKLLESAINKGYKVVTISELIQ